MEESDAAPFSVYDQYTVDPDAEVTGRAVAYTCIHCNATFKSTSRSRLVQHLLRNSKDVCKCTGVGRLYHAAKKVLEAEQQAKDDAASAQRRLQAAAATAAAPQGSGMQPASLQQATLTGMLKQEAVTALHDAVADCFYANALPFNGKRVGCTLILTYIFCAS
jgi:hypothetical protein